MENYRSLHHIKFNLCLTLYSHHTFHIFYGCFSSSRRWQSAASAALLGELKEVSGGLGQKSPTDAEIEILNSRMVLGKVIDDLNLNISIQDQNNSFFKNYSLQKKAN